MKWESFKPFFHPSWHKKMKPFIESAECDQIYEHLKNRGKKGHKIAPISSLTYRCFMETPLDQLKVVLMGMCPYHTVFEGAPIADGLLLGCTVTGKLQPSLQSFYSGIEKDLYNGLSLSADLTPDVSYLANQGVLMLNAALTVEINKPGSHQAIWEPLIKYLYDEVFNPGSIPTIFLGKEAARCKKFVGPFMWTFETSSHPSSATYVGSEWETDGVFSKVNKILYENTGEDINWLKDAQPPF